MNWSIRIENLGKKYRRGEVHQLNNNFRHSVGQFFKSCLGRSSSGKTDSTQDFWALENINLQIEQGEMVGIIGRNGAGKSTLLKILSRITSPSCGSIRYRGRIASLLEVGTGFHRELTGRENIFLNGAILGMSRQMISRKFDEIAAFAEIDQFLDTPVKFYSSGMYIRLAFAVAAHLEPDILIVDEVLAVGDASFQKKCLGKMGEFSKSGGRTVLFVSHNLTALQGLCKRGVWLHAGKVVADGDTKAVVADYHRSIDDLTIQKLTQNSEGPLLLEKVVVTEVSGKRCSIFNFQQDIRIEIHYEALKKISKPYFWIGIGSQFGSLFGANMLLDNLRPASIEGRGVLSCVFRNVKLLPQSFTIHVGVRDENGMKDLIPAIEAAVFRIQGEAVDMGMPGAMANNLLEHSSPMLVPYEWHFHDGGVHRPNFKTNA